MNTEPRGAADPRGDLDPADAQLHDRLARRFGAEMARAERDFASRPIDRPVAGKASVGTRAPRARVGWPRMATTVVAVGAVAVIGLIGAGLASRPAPVSGPPPVPGMPGQIDGQKVYWVSERTSFPTDGTYLVGGYVISVACPTGLAEIDPPCFALAAAPGDGRASGVIDLGAFQQGSVWVGLPVVVRMANCTLEDGTPCPAAPKEVAWPQIPGQLDGQKVYRAFDQASFPTNGSFLLGGRFSKPDVMPPCPAPVNLPEADQQLVPYCYIETIDGLVLAPMGAVDEPKDELVIARVHVNDPLAAQCSTANAAACKSSLVVDSIVWRSDVLIVATQQTALPSSTYPAATTPTPTAQPSGTVPDQIAGQKVYTMDNRSEWASFTTSFYLYAEIGTVSMACLNVSIGPAEDDLIGGTCPTLVLAMTSISKPSDYTRVAPKAKTIFRGWINAPPIVMRVHTHDPEAAQCTAGSRAACEAAVVVEAVVWPEIPAELNGEKVYRAGDEVSFPTDRSFLLGGVYRSESAMGCPIIIQPDTRNQAEKQLLGSSPCVSPAAIDGLLAAPLNGRVDEPNGEVLVARVHIHDPLAAQCTNTYKDQCETAIVVESVVWRSVVLPSLTPSSSQTAGPSPTTPP
jgi:hypothetical protein